MRRPSDAGTSTRPAMSRRRSILFISLAVCALVVATACSKQQSSPTSPSSTSAADASANADGSKLKSSAPVPQSPVNNARPEGPNVTLTVVNAGMKYGAEGVQLRALGPALRLPLATTRASRRVSTTPSGAIRSSPWRPSQRSAS